MPLTSGVTGVEAKALDSSTDVSMAAARLLDPEVAENPGDRFRLGNRRPKF
jgi:hypothetical protein